MLQSASFLKCDFNTSVLKIKNLRAGQESATTEVLGIIKARERCSLSKYLQPGSKTNSKNSFYRCAKKLKPISQRFILVFPI